MRVDAAPGQGSESLGQRFRKRRLAFSWLAVWVAGWAALVPSFIHGYRAAFFYGGVTPMSVMRAPGLAQVHALFGVDLFGAMYLAVAAIFVAVMVGLFTLEAVAWRLQLDRDDLSVTATRWTARAVPVVALLWALGAILVVLSAVVAQGFRGAGIANYVPTAIAGAVWLGLTFFALNSAELRRESPALFWRAAWPGLQALLVAIVLGAVIAGLNWTAGAAIAAASLTAPAAMAIYFIAAIASLWPLSAILSLWLNRAPLRWLTQDASRIFSRRTLSALLVLDVRMVVWASLVFLVPATIVFVMLLLLVPLADAFNAQTGADFPALVSASIAFAKLCQSWWWVVVPIFPTLLLIARGRLYVLLGLVPAGK